MEVDSSHELVTSQHAAIPIVRGGWDARLAHWVSQIASPPTQAVLSMALSARQTAAPASWLWAGMYTLMAVIPPLLYVAWQVRRGRITDLHIQLREQRSRPFVAALAGTALAWLIMVLGGAPRLLLVITAAGWIQLVLLLTVTLRWKISVHAAASAGTAVVALFLLGAPAVPLAVSVPLIAWARIRLKRHTLAQTIAGALLGTAVYWVAMSVWRA